jgi:thioredoxin 1
MSTVNVTEKNFDALTTQEEGIVIIDAWAPWCGPCRTFGPTFEAAAEKHADITFAKLNTEDEQRIAGGLAIRSIPTLMVLKDGVLIFRQAGALPASAFEQLIGQVREVDMEDVRAKMAAEAS